MSLSQIYCGGVLIWTTVYTASVIALLAECYYVTFGYFVIAIPSVVCLSSVCNVGIPHSDG